MGAKDRGEWKTIGGDGREKGLVTKRGEKSTTDMGAGLTPDYNDK